MSRLSDLVHGAIINSTLPDGSLLTHDAVESIKPDLDDEGRETLITEALTARVTTAAKNGKSAIMKMSERCNFELPFAGLHGSYPLDLDGRYVKRTESLLRAEMEHVISIREKQIVDDTKHLSELRTAFIAVEPIWEKNPHFTFGQCCSALMKRASA